MNIRQILTGATLTTLIGFAAHAHAGLLGGAVGGGWGGGFGGGNFGSAGSLGAAGEFNRPHMDSQRVKSTASTVAGNAAGRVNAVADNARQSTVQTEGGAQSAAPQSKTTGGNKPKSAPEQTPDSGASGTHPAPAMTLGGDGGSSITAGAHSASENGTFDAEHSPGTSSVGVGGSASAQ